MICTPDLNCPGFNKPELCHATVRGDKASISALFDLKPGVDAEQFARSILRIVLNYNVKSRSECPNTTFDRLTEIVPSSYKKWDSRYNELVEFLDKDGKFNIDYKNRTSLETWISAQRMAYKKGSLSEERIAKLLSVNFVWDVNDEKWNVKFDLLSDFMKKWPFSCSYKRECLACIYTKTSKKNLCLIKQKLIN